MIDTTDEAKRGEVELSCVDLHATVEALRDVGFHVETIFPADDPGLAIVCGHGVRLRLLRGTTGSSVTIRIPSAAPAPPRTIDAGGLRLALVSAHADMPSLDPPYAPSFVVTRNDPAAWHVGRAGMHYRDLIPDRQGGRFIASHIRIPDGGPVPDFVHFHAVRFQMIYCHKGWVRLVYEDQGEPFVMKAGEIVLQPPKIRHRVLECSAGLEVVEIGSPAIHTTHGDPKMSLPNANVRPDREFDGQRFFFGPATAEAIASASRGRAAVRVVRGSTSAGEVREGAFLFGFLLSGELTLGRSGKHERLREADAFVIPAGAFSLAAESADATWLEVTAPAA